MARADRRVLFLLNHLIHQVAQYPADGGVQLVLAFDLVTSDQISRMFIVSKDLFVFVLVGERLQQQIGTGEDVRFPHGYPLGFSFSFNFRYNLNGLADIGLNAL